MVVRNMFAVPLVLAGGMLGFGAQEAPPSTRPEARSFDVLIFSKTAGFRHDSIPDGIEAIRRLGEEHGFTVEATEDAAHFTNENLAKYEAVIFLSTTGNVLDDDQQEAFEAYIRAGGGYVGVHAAADTEYDWPWYGKLVGAYFKTHPRIQPAEIIVEDRTHPSTKHLPERWPRTDEWYTYRDNPRERVKVLMSLDESTYEGGGMNGDHPIAWHHEFEGGRAFYTGGGHTKESFREKEFLQHMLGGIRWAAGATAKDAAAPASAPVPDREELDPNALAPQTPAQDAAEALSNDDLVRIGVALLLEKQEGDANAEWPYEGVYRVREEGERRPIIPIGYRVGGTGIVGLALLEAPETEADESRTAALERATEFICTSIEHPLMSFENYTAGYDVRGWGYCYALLYLLRMKALDRVPDAQSAAVEGAISFYLKGVHETEIPQSGGWNYARPNGRENPAPMSPFMTGPTLQALFQAKAQGYAVDEAIVRRGLEALDRARTETGAYVYSGTSEGRGARSATPGAAARMAVAESTLMLAGRGDASRLRGAVDAFFTHWDRLEERRAKTGTHEGPFGIAPYYFYFGHYYTAQAIELLPAHERNEYRRRLKERLLVTRAEDGSWNDRVFPRSAAYGTAMSMLALRAPDTDPIARWISAAE